MASSSRIACFALVGLAVLLGAAPAAAQEPRQVAVRLTLVHASPRPGAIDPGAQRLHQQLQKEFRYQSLRVMQQSRLQMPMRETRQVELPTGGSLRMRPLELDPQGLLMALEMKGRLDTRVMLQPRKQVVIGAERYQDGKLIIAIESDY